MEKAAALIHVKPGTLKVWLGQIRKHGMTAMLVKWGTIQSKPAKIRCRSRDALRPAQRERRTLTNANA